MELLLQLRLKFNIENPGSQSKGPLLLLSYQNLNEINSVRAISVWNYARGSCSFHRASTHPSPSTINISPLNCQNY